MDVDMQIERRGQGCPRSVRFMAGQRLPPVLLLVYANAGQARRLSYDEFMARIKERGSCN